MAAARLIFTTGTINIITGLLTAGVSAEFAITTKIVDAIIAGSSIAAIVDHLAGGGLGGSTIASIRSAIDFHGRAKAISCFPWARRLGAEPTVPGGLWI